MMRYVFSFADNSLKLRFDELYSLFNTTIKILRLSRENHN